MMYCTCKFPQICTYSPTGDSCWGEQAFAGGGGGGGISGDFLVNTGDR